MTHGRPKDELTLLVFKDNHSARTFRVPLVWISRLGWLASGALVLTLLSSGLAIRYFSEARRHAPAHVQDLEQEVFELRASNRGLEEKLVNAKNLASANIPSVPAAASTSGNAPATPSAQAVAPLSAPFEAPSAPPMQSAPAASRPPDAHPALFSLLPILPGLRSGEAIPDPSTLPIKLESPQATWRGKSLKIKFSIQYIRGDGGNQQGRILILAKGPDRIWAYPEGLFRQTGARDSLADPDRGEYFSVSRFRAVEAEVGPIASRDSLRELEAIILGPDHRILITQLFSPSEPSRLHKSAAQPDSPVPAPSEGGPQ